MRRTGPEVHGLEHQGAPIRFQGVSRHFTTPDGDRVPAIVDVELTAAAGEFMSLVGPSGCGKSTLLNMAAGLLPPSTGSVSVGEIEIVDVKSAISAGVGLISQAANLLPWLTVMQNMVLPLKIRGVPKSEREDRARHWLEQVHLSGVEKYYPSQLSGGMQKRCSVARTLAYEPRVLMMDEPFGALDALTKLALQDLVLQIFARLEYMTILFVTHDLAEAVALSDKIAVIVGRPGRISEIATVNLPRPRDVFHLSEVPEFGHMQARLWDKVVGGRAELEERRSVESAPGFSASTSNLGIEA